MCGVLVWYVLLYLSTVFSDKSAPFAWGCVDICRQTCRHACMTGADIYANIDVQLGGFLECPMVQKYTKNISKHIQIYPRYTKIYQDIQNTKRRRGRPARPGPEAIFGQLDTRENRKILISDGSDFSRKWNFQ